MDFTNGCYGIIYSAYLCLKRVFRKLCQLFKKRTRRADVSPIYIVGGESEMLVSVLLKFCNLFSDL